MSCKRGCPKRCREAAVNAGWVLLTEGEWAGWWEHPTLSPYQERRFRDEDCDKNPTKVALQRPSIRRHAVGVIARDVGGGLKDFLKRLGMKDEDLPLTP